MSVKPGDRIALHLGNTRIIADVVEVQTQKRTIRRDTASGEFTTAADAEARPGQTETEHR